MGFLSQNQWLNIIVAWHRFAFYLHTDYQLSSKSVEISNMLRRQKQAKCTGNIWGLIESKPFSELKKDFMRFFHSQTFENWLLFICNRLESVEEPNCYGLGSLHLIYIEDSFDHGKYTVIHKLGHRLSSTIWLAWNSTLNTYVAIKILTAEASKICNKLWCLEYFSSKPCSMHSGQEHISALFLDRHFWLDSPNSRHLALVSKVSGPSIG